MKCKKLDFVSYSCCCSQGTIYIFKRSFGKDVVLEEKVKELDACNEMPELQFLQSTLNPVQHNKL